MKLPHLASLFNDVGSLSMKHDLSERDFFMSGGEMLKLLSSSLPVGYVPALLIGAV